MRIIVTNDESVEDLVPCIYAGVNTWVVPIDCEQILSNKGIEYRVRELIEIK